MSAPEYISHEEYKRRVQAAYESDDLEGLSGEAVRVAWTGGEFPESIYPSEFWVRAFRHPRSVEWFSFSPGSEPLTVYRGTVPEYQRGMAWTTDPAIAYRFAWGRVHFHYPPDGGESPNEAFVYRTQVERSAVLCEVDLDLLPGRRGEGEVIVDPGQLGEIECVRTVHRGDDGTYQS